MPFTHLHCHSHFSLLDGLPKIEELVEKVRSLGMDSVALTDHGVMYGAVEFYNACKSAGVKPIVGLEAYIAPRKMSDKDHGIDNEYFHLTLLAKNQEGYKNLMLLTTAAHLDGFYYKPRIDLEILKKYSNGLICLSGCQRGEIARAALNKSPEEAQKTLNKYLDIFSPENLYIEIQRNSRDRDQAEEKLNQTLITLAKQNGLMLAATADCHYLDYEDAEAQDVLVCIGTGRTVSDSDRLDMRAYDLSLKSPERMLELFSDVPEAVKNTEKIAEMCNLEILIDQRYFPAVEIPGQLTAEEYITQLTYEKSLPIYGQAGVLPQNIKDRIDYELNIINKKGFTTYFLMVADVVEGAHKVGAITNTRGSAAGSIVGYILGITNVDPLYYELPFERFLTMHRPTPPDIDLDIADNRRDEAIEYITQRFGKEKVAQIITFGTMMARAAVRDVGRALAVSYSKCDRLAKMIPLGKQGFQMTIDKALDINKELKEAYDQDPETKKIIDIAKKLEGGARHASVHAAGIVITPTPLTDYMPLQKEPDGERVITQYDMYGLDVNANSKAIGVVKLDLLGIRNLSILEAAVRLVKKRHNIEVDIYNLPHPDEKTFKLLSEGLTFGVFQMGSSGMTRYLKELKPSSVFDIMAMIALYRPGPMQFIPEYIARKHNPSLITYFDPAFEKILSRTYGILVYQDDLLTIAHDLAGYSWEEVDKFRKAVGKKIPEEMAKQKIKFIQGCTTTSGWSHNKASEIWNWIEPFAAYGFNKAHSASYSSVSYQTAYMKANFPVEFMAAVMTAESGDEEKIYEAVEECKNLGIKVLPPDVSESLGDFTVVNSSTIRFGLNAIKNLGTDVIEKIIEARGRSVSSELNSNNLALSPITFVSLEDFLIRTHVKNFNKRSWEALAKSGALDAFGERGNLLANTEEVLRFSREYFQDKESKQTSLFGSNTSFSKLSIRESQPASKEEMLAWEKEHLGMFVSAHPLDSFSKVLKKLNSVRDVNTGQVQGQAVCGGIITKLKRIITKKNEPMAFFTLQDQTGSIEVLVFPKTMEKVVQFLEPDRIIQVTARLSTAERKQYPGKKTATQNSGDDISSFPLASAVMPSPSAGNELAAEHEEVKLIAEEIIYLPNDDAYNEALSEMEKTKQLTIFMQKMPEMEILNKVKNILEKFPGKAQVFLLLGVGQGAKKIKTHTLVGVDNALIQELRTIKEVGKVEVS